MQRFFEYASHTLDISVGKIYKDEKKGWNTFSTMPMPQEDEDEDICFIEESGIREKEIQKKAVQ